MHNVAQFTQCEYIWGTKPQNHQIQPHWQTAEFGPGKNSRENDVSKTLCSVFLTKARCSWGNSFLKWHITTYIWAFPSTMQLVTSVTPLGLAPNHGYQGLTTSPVGQTFTSLPLSADITHLSFRRDTHMHATLFPMHTVQSLTGKFYTYQLCMLNKILCIERSYKKKHEYATTTHYQ